MNFRLDHIVIAVADLARTVHDYRALGFTVQIGGKHAKGTSHNALIVFEDGAYFELIAWESPDSSHPWHDRHVKHGDGLMDFALMPENVRRAIDAAKARGLALNGPLEGGRERPDGQTLKWQTARPNSADLPFFCGDVTSRDLRVPAGDACKHANGATGVATVVVAVSDIHASVERYAAMLALDATTLRPAMLPGMDVCAVFLDLGTTTLALMSPSRSASGESGGFAAKLLQQLMSRGEGPAAVALRSGRERHELDAARTHGVLLEMGEC